MSGPGGPARRDPRIYLITHVLILGYLAAAGLVAALDPGWLRPRWLALHLLFLGAATTAIVLWSSHFAQALTRAGADRWLGPRLATLTAGSVAVLAGVGSGEASGLADAAVVAGAALVVGSVGVHMVVLGRMAAARFGGPLRRVAWFYVAAGAAFLAGASIGGALGVGEPSAVVGEPTVEAVHAHLNLLGWIGLTVLGTLFMLWPAALRVRMDPALPRALGPVLALTTVGLALTVGGLWPDIRPLTAVGLALYLVGVAVLARPMLATVRHSSATRGPALALGLASLWLAAFVVTDMISVLRDGATGAMRTVHDLMPVVGAGFVGQILVGALSFLIPVVFGGGPAGHKRLAGILVRWWAVRVAATNIGLVVALVAAEGWVAVAGWALALGGLGSFLPLAVTALLTRTGPRGQPLASA